MTLLRWLTFLLVLLFWIHFFCLAQAFCLFRSSDVIVSVSIEFPQTQKEMPHFITQLMTILMLIGVVFVTGECFMGGYL